MTSKENTTKKLSELKNFGAIPQLICSTSPSLYNPE